VTPELEEALYELYKGQTNVAVKAKELDMPLSVLKTTLSRFIRSRPVDEDVWLRDFQLGWPYLT
jgi:hypothetical protein